MKYIVTVAIILLMIFYVVPQVIWPVVRASMSEASLQGDLVIIGIIAIGAAVMVTGILGILAKKD